MEISKLSGIESNIKEYIKILTAFHLQYFFKKSLFSVNMPFPSLTEQNFGLSMQSLENLHKFCSKYKKVWFYH